MDSTNSPSTKPLYYLTRIIWYILGIVVVLLIFRIFLKALGANSAAGFTRLIYEITNPLAAPFLAVFNVTQIQGSMIEWTTLLAMLVYWVIAVAIINLFLMGRSVSTREAADKLEKEKM